MAAWAGMILAGQSAWAQSAGGDSQARPVIPPPRWISRQALAQKNDEQVPRIAQTPQSPQVPYGQPTWPLPGNIGSAPATPPGFGPYIGEAPTPPAPGMTTSDMGAVNNGGIVSGPPSAAPATGIGYDALLSGAEFGAGGGATTNIADNPGYIDSAIIRSRIRQRFDVYYQDSSPDKAEFFYAKCGCFSNPKILGIPSLASKYDPTARGPQHMLGSARKIDKYPGTPSLNYQEVATYVEYAPLRNFSVFAEVPARFVQPVLGASTAGFSDVNMGFKYAFVANPNEYYTFQFRTYTPTGNSYQGLGTGHVSFEPALLVFQRLTDRLYFNGEFRDWIPVGATDFAGNVLRYGVGLTYNFVLTDHFRIAPVNEIVGWTILGGKELQPDPTAPNPLYAAVSNVAGQTIVNEKIGLRIGLGDYSQEGGGSALNDRHSLYVGYSRAISGDYWYKNMFRLEYNFWF